MARQRNLSAEHVRHLGALVPAPDRRCPSTCPRDSLWRRTAQPVRRGPTLLGLCGLPNTSAERLPGRSAAPLLRGAHCRCARPWGGLRRVRPRSACCALADLSTITSLPRRPPTSVLTTWSRPRRTRTTRWAMRPAPLRGRAARDGCRPGSRATWTHSATAVQPVAARVDSGARKARVASAWPRDMDLYQATHGRSKAI